MLKSVAGLLLISALASAFQVPSDCLVSERIVENEILFDTVEFLALIPETGIIQARIICHDKTERYLEWNSQKVSTPTTLTKSPPDTGGWTRFALGVIGKLSLSDDRNQTWLSLDLPHDECVVSSVELKGSKFTHKCSAGSPVWKVSDEAVTIPLRLNGTTSETISLFSLTPFSPVLGIGGSETHLRMNGDQMVANGDYYNPLSAVTNYRLEFGVSEESGSTVFQAFLLDESKRSLYTLNLPGVPKEMHVRSKDKTKFVLVQYLKREKEEYNNTSNCTEVHDNTTFPSTETVTCSECSKYKDSTFLLLLSILACITIFFGILLVQYIRLLQSQKQHPEGYVTSTPSRQQPHQQEPEIHQMTQVSPTVTCPRQHQYPDVLSFPLPALPTTSVSQEETHYEMAPTPPAPLSRLPSHPKTSASLGDRCSEVAPTPPASLLPPPAPLTTSDTEEETYYEMEPTPPLPPPPKSFDLHLFDGEETINDVYQSAD